MTTLFDLADPDVDLAPLVEALLDGGLAVIPTDTVYGLACAAHLPAAYRLLAEVKGRDPAQPTAVICSSVDSVFSTVLPELFGTAGVQARRLLPGPVTLVVPNPSGRFSWLCGSEPDRIGVRVPRLDPRLAEALDRVGAVVATSANLHGGPDPTSLAEVPEEIIDRASVVIDGGPAPARRPSTVIDLSGSEPTVLREGALSRDEVLALLRAS